MVSSLRIRRLERADRRDAFCSGEPVLDRFIRQYAGQNQFRHHIAVTYVSVEESAREVLGYVTVAAGTLDTDEALSVGLRHVPYTQLPIVRIARLAVDARLTGSGLGQDLLLYALRLALEQSESVGCAGVVVDAKAGTEGFYEQYGFRVGGFVRGTSAVRPRQTMMFLSVARILASMGDESLT